MASKAPRNRRNFRYTAKPKDSALGFAYDYDYLEYLEKKDPPGAAWNRVLTERSAVVALLVSPKPRGIGASWLFKCFADAGSRYLPRSCANFFWND